MGDVVTGVEGLGKLQKKLNRYSDPEKYFDDDIYRAVNGAREQMQNATPTYTFFTRREWTEIKKVQNSVYQIENNATSKDGKHAIVNIIRHGRGAVRPKKAKALFIPLNAKTADKIREDNWENIDYGLDYVLRPYAKPTVPNDFVTPVEEKLKKQMVKNVVKRINKDWK